MNAGLPPDIIDSALAHGLSRSEVERQWARLHLPSRLCVPEAPCALGSGILKLDPARCAELEERGRRLQAIRFIPASGAATRMFKALLARDISAIAQLHQRWDEFPFVHLAEASGPCDTPEQKWSALIERLGLHLRPKGTLPFHVEPTGIVTAFEAQLSEWAATLDEPSPMHFTLPQEGFETWLDVVQEAASAKGIPCTASVQDPSTDTLAVGEDGAPFLLEDGQPLWRPGGHGALIRNLQDLADAHPGQLVSIKNIDNVRPQSADADVLPWRRALLGLAAECVERRASALAALAEGDTGPARDWLQSVTGRQTSEFPDGLEAWRAALDRPLLIAGMVRNEGEPGGGPYWLRDDEGVLRTQIVEASEMNMEDPQTLSCMAGATHFNPVDLVCALHRSDGSAHDLSQFVDASRDFVVGKSHDGRALTGLEHPGLWNGGMGRWNTLFVEVDSATFAPVKTVFDLLRPAHRVG